MARGSAGGGVGLSIGDVLFLDEELSEHAPRTKKPAAIKEQAATRIRWAGVGTYFLGTLAASAQEDILRIDISSLLELI